LFLRAIGRLLTMATLALLFSISWHTVAGSEIIVAIEFGFFHAHTTVPDGYYSRECCFNEHDLVESLANLTHLQK